MLSFQMVIILTGALTAAACATVGTFLVLRRVSMIGDAISHSVLLGIVGVFWLTGGNRSEPLMVLGAGLVGLLTVFLIEAVRRTGRVREDAAIGLVFPALFSIGVILVSRFPATVHIDVQHVLYGEIAFSPLRRLELFGTDVGYRSLWVLGTMTVINLAFVIFFYKELKLTSFDPGLAAALGFAPVLMHYSLMALVSATTVVAFDSVGAILVVAMLIVPPATAYLLTDRLSTMIGLGIGAGVISAWGGYLFAQAVNGSISGSIATASGALFAFAFLISPRYGVVAQMIRRARLRSSFNLRLLVSHLEGQHGTADVPALRKRFRWTDRTERELVASALREGYVSRAANGQLLLTERGRTMASEVIGVPIVRSEILPVAQ